ncbi:MAG: hypothetical protein JRH10_02480 [Deltaproteobacteria bacterium]|nr:hypothetical protein [Deltaproteobacteria bacterium]MBW2444725.1 hypothetical protein [Deltaproteobacteria bacterium]
MNLTIEIATRFCGPPDSGNGGYLAGRLAAYVDAPAVAVRLRVPPPLGRALRVERSEDTATLFDGETRVAEARAAKLDLSAPPSPTFDEAMEAARAFRGYDEHVFPGCFVCGPERGEGDGLRIFPGALGTGPLFAAPWLPDASLADTDGKVASEFAWAALDCPGAFAFPQIDGVCLLGELCASLTGTVQTDEPCVVTSWEIGHEGRKHFTGSALHGEDGACRGVALGTWIELPRS